MTFVKGTVNSSTPSSGLDGKTAALLRELDVTTDPQRRRLLCDEIIESSLALADRLAGRYRDRGMEADDLRQVARTALVQAVGRFAGGGEQAFLGYVIPSIRGELKRHFRDRGWSIRPPRGIQEATQSITRARAELCQTLGHAPAAEELAAATDLDLDTVRQAQHAQKNYRTESLDRPLNESDAVTFGETCGSVDPGFEQTESRVLVSTLLDQLEARERTVIFLRYFRGRTQREVGERIGVTQMQVSRIESKILRQFRDVLEPDGTAAA